MKKICIICCASIHVVSGWFGGWPGVFIFSSIIKGFYYQGYKIINNNYIIPVLTRYFIFNGQYRHNACLKPLPVFSLLQIYKPFVILLHFSGIIFL